MTSSTSASPRRPRRLFLFAPAVLLPSLLLAGGCRDNDTPRFARAVGASQTPTGTSGASGRTDPPAATPRSFADVVDRVAPAVTTIRSARRARAPRQFPFMMDPFFRDFFGDPGAPPQGGQGRVVQGLGSGVIVTADGYCLTNHHVIDGAEDIRVEFTDGRSFQAKVVGSDPPSDLAVLKIDARDLPVLTPGNSDEVRVGDIVLAVGNPLGVGQTVTMGIISAKGRSTGLSDGSFEDFLQTDAPINQGNSGGALVNATGQLIGINSQILTSSGGNIGIGFAIPSNMARDVMEELIKNGRVTRGQLGVTVQQVTPEIAASLGNNNLRGVIVNSVQPDSAAAKAGIRQGDVITKFNGTAVEEPNTLRNRVASTDPGAQVTVTVWRDGREQEVRATLGELQADAPPDAQGPGGSGSGGGQLGIGVVPVTPDIARKAGLPENTQGLLVQTVDPAGPAAQAGVMSGDVILEINRQPVRSADDVKRALDAAESRPALLLINRRGQNVFVTVQQRRQ